MSYAELDPREANRRRDEFLIIDVRERHEFGGPLGCIEGAKLVPVGTIAAHADRLNGSSSA